MLKFKIIIIGAKKVGKTSLIKRFSTENFDILEQPTIGVNFATKSVLIDDNTLIIFNIWDFAGDDKFRLLFPSYISGASGVLFLYDITNKDSLQSLHEWVNLILSIPNHPKSMLLIETKKDLEEKRDVNKKEAIEFFNQFQFQGRILCTSAKTGENVEKVFQTLGREILKNSLRHCPNCGLLYILEQKFCPHCLNIHNKSL